MPKTKIKNITYRHLDNIGISESSISTCNLELPQQKLTNGLVLDIDRLRKRLCFEEAITLTWIKGCFDSATSTYLEEKGDLVLTEIRRIFALRDEYRRKKNAAQIEVLESHPFMVTNSDHESSPSSPSAPEVVVPSSSSESSDEIQNEAPITRQTVQIHPLDHQILKKQRRIQVLENNILDLEGFDIVNAKRREKRHKNEISRLKMLVKDLGGNELEKLREEVANLKKQIGRERNMKSYFKTKKKPDQSRSGECIEDVNDVVEVTSNEEVHLKDGKNIKPNVRLCISQLTSLETATHKVGPIINAVASNIFGVTFSEKELPGRQTCANNADQTHFLIKKYYGETLSKRKHLGYNKDGTSRKKRKIVNAAITVDTGEIFPLGFTRVAHETGETIANVAKDSFQELAMSFTAGTDESPDDFLQTQLAKLSFLMSDRAANEKLSNKLIDEWRTQTLENAGLPKEDIGIVHQFHCMAHVLLGFHSYIKSKLEVEFDGQVLGRDQLPQFRTFAKEVAAIRTARMVCEVAGPVPDEKNGIRDQWEAHCRKQNIKTLLINYRDNRFNGLFQAAACIYHHEKHLTECIEKLPSVRKRNKKIVSVLADLKDHKVMLTLKMLGIIYMKLTGPYWELITSSHVHHLDLHRYIQCLHHFCMQMENDPLPLLNPEQDPIFQDFPPNINHPFYQTVCSTPVPDDQIEDAVNILKAIFKALNECITKQLSAFIDGPYSHAPSSTEKERTKGAHHTNMSCERYFGTLDSSMSRRKNATLHYHSTILLMKACRTRFPSWMREKSIEEQKSLWALALKEGKKLRQKHLSDEKNQLIIIEDELDRKLIEAKKKKANIAIKNAKKTRAKTLQPREPVKTRVGDWIAVAYDDRWYPGDCDWQACSHLLISFLF
jgi:hypothetical protein